MNKILEHLIALYGDDVGRATLAQLESLISNHQSQIPVRRLSALTERDAVLITYGDQVHEPNAPPLRTLADFCARHLTGIVNTIHVLPFYPYSSDDGFAVVDYRAVNPALGDWNDVARVGANFRLMFDAVINHVSAQSAWFQGFLRDDPRYRDFFIVAPDDADVSRVIRPRTLPLLTKFETPSGARNVWTTFSADQTDLNYRNPAVLIEVIATLLFYLARGADWIRLDAIAFLWKEPGTTCLHLPQTHRVIQLLRAIVDHVAPHVILITETNVPHADNVSYFGDGTNEAHLVYNFALPPLTLHAFHTSDARMLTRWASALTLPSHQVTFFNFLASHDGIGLNPARGILSEADLDALVARTLANGGLVSYKTNPDETASPYELNINYFDALSDPNATEPLDTQIDRFVAAHAMMLALVGVPGIYFHNLFGSRSWRAGVAQTGQNRTINREKLERAALERELSDPTARRHRVFTRLAQLLHARAAHPAFSPYGEMRVLDVNPAIFALQRISATGETVLCLQNVSYQPQPAQLDSTNLLGTTSDNIIDLLTNQVYAESRVIHLTPFQTLWLTRKNRE
ncbi:sucrose phosphorylase [Anaerolineae bacterium]|nr:sucrose phosphorylase [Anaerolineae bacterium]